MVDFTTDGVVYTTTLFNNRNSNFGTRYYRLVDAHRGFTQHQFTITCPNAISGEYKVNIIPDTASFNIIDAVDIGESIVMTNETSAMILFSAVLRGIELIKVVGFDLGEVVTGVLSSTRGQA